jgi:hypothetical protein
MPYELVKVIRGFKVVDPATNRIFSTKALSKKQATKQRIAIALSESKKTGKPVKSFFL